jgi:quercetin dioxygenase-like cupin family protein
VWHFFDGALQTWKVKEDGKSFTSGQRFKAGNPHSGVGRKSTATPPYHIHLFQTETFDVKEGTLCYLIDGKEGKLQAGQKVDIPPYRPHTVSVERIERRYRHSNMLLTLRLNHQFWNDPSTGTDLVVQITVRGGDNPG